MHRLLTAAAAALTAGFALPAAAQTAATATTEAQAQAATGQASTDQPAATQAQGAAKAVQQGAAPAAAAQGAAPAASAAAAVKPAGDIIETARAAGQFKTFIKAADATNLTGLLKRNPGLTVFAPTDAAFAALPAGELDRLMADKPALQKLLTHHIINATVDSSKIAGARGPVPTVAQDNLLLDGSQEGVLKADGATIVQADVRATNGVLHVVDRVLTPGQSEQAVGAEAGAATSASATAASSSSQP